MQRLVCFSNESKCPKSVWHLLTLAISITVLLILFLMKSARTKKYEIGLLTIVGLGYFTSCFVIGLTM